MARFLPSIFPLCFQCIIVTSVLGFIPKLIHSLTLESDIQVLRALKHSFDPNSVSSTSYLNTWDFMGDPCDCAGEQFLGILCSIPVDDSPSRIISIDLDGAGYDGFLTPSIGNLTELTILSLSKNKIRRTIPETISKLRKLTRLSLAANSLVGTIPNEITLLKNLEYLDLSGNRLSGSIPINISGLRSLTHLSLSSNTLTGTIPDLTGLWQLNYLDLGSNQLYGNLPYFPVRLTTLSINHNILTGHISPIKKLKDLIRLDASANRFSGVISRDILSLPRLVHLNVSNNHFTATELVNFSAEETELQVLDAQNNQFHGYLPANLVKIQNLTTINLAHNQFSGPIPRGYGAKLKRPWRILYLDDNFLSGKLPPEFISHGQSITGSLARNCLRCPTQTPLCRGGQKTISECLRKNNSST
ncbi:LRR receptor-like serine/threonine-protein kinase FLS2 [Juglans microcarpa x Juglans regia]|uniref:LRR receptor-like serine/threonine-protein kinase FLS2 n=1 Tax=Juglans microcarpa x Juglans regia TaxID=2249226 RepID=UPI001B7E29AE|nr:LRR receptor-like serine/threonine-protein kinase FLS2 [Juglans microcarpa x Juglans regia]